MDWLISAGQVLRGPVGERIPDGAVLVSDSRIVAVGKRSEVAALAPEGVRRLHRPEATVLPGMINAHVHLAFDASPDPVATLHATEDAELAYAMAEHAGQLVRSGVTTARDLGDRGGLALGLRDAISIGKIPGPRLLVANAPLTVSGGHCWFFGGEVDGEQSARAMVRSNVAAGADLIKVMASGGQMTPAGAPMWEAQFSTEELAAIVDEAHLAGRRVAAHAHGPDAIASSVAAGVDTIEHCSWLGEGKRYEPREEVAIEMAAKGISVCATNSSDWRGFAERIGQERAVQMFGRLNWLDELGVRMIAGSDAGLAGSVFDDLVGSFGVLEDQGFTLDRILEMATVHAAEALGLGAEVGTLADGFSADLLVVDGDPLNDLDALRRLELVLAGGRQHVPA